MNITTETIRKYWTPISHLFSINNEEEYDRAIEFLDSLIDEIGTDERHPLYELLDTLGTVVHAYEEKNCPIPESEGVEMLRFFMDKQGLKPFDLPEIGSEKTVLEIVGGKRELTVRHIHILAERFHVSPAVFV